MKSYNRTIAFVFTAALAAGCTGPAAQPRAESEAMARSRMMLARLDRLEADLHSEATATDTYAVLQERHGQASQVACKVTDEHVNEMHRLLVAQLEKRKEKLAQRNGKLARLSKAHASARGRAGHGKMSRAAVSAGRTPVSAPGRRASASSGRAPSANPATAPSHASPAAQGRAPSAAGRAPGKTVGALSMR